MTSPPAPRRLKIAWAVLAGLTVASMSAALPAAGPSGTLAWPVVTFVLVVTWVKAHQILGVYLGLSAASAGWRGFLGGLVMVILVVILGGHLLIGVMPSP